jgi:hypothetical protein
MPMISRHPVMHVGIGNLAQIRQNPLNNRARVDEAQVSELVERYGLQRLPFNVLIDRDNLVLSGYAGIIPTERLRLDKIVTTRAAPELSIKAKQAYLIDDGYSEIAVSIGPQSGSKHRAKLIN